MKTNKRDQYPRWKCHRFHLLFFRTQSEFLGMLKESDLEQNTCVKRIEVQCNTEERGNETLRQGTKLTVLSVILSQKNAQCFF